jgi:thiamine-phosphate pyrophosphorylase
MPRLVKPVIPTPPLLVISDRHLARIPLPDLVEAAFKAGLRWFMVREKDLEEKALGTLVGDIVTRARPYGALVTVNGNPTVAARHGADGVHLPQGHDVAETRRITGDGVLIGVSAHNESEACKAADDGADYVTLSPIFTPTSKPGYGPALGVDELHRIAVTLPIPVIALGGVTADNSGTCRPSGIAVLGGVMATDDPVAAVVALLDVSRA